ncbi:hypothetical protein EB1_01020 [Empedobacter brevis NBRC 14943 = ATCC 43319]|uniref:Uncharacterized protein n=1 Tax=Empedobacter brevis NBRC 14943 = ATCC 43319 TaxID=1218108 RepID=A0A511NBY0_9FLAO|nr:hypothetical protein EB1_01020 [Empedobacter brevis NBRC 14943 = ATCC 43319]
MDVVDSVFTSSEFSAFASLLLQLASNAKIAVEINSFFIIICIKSKLKHKYCEKDSVEQFLFRLILNKIM